jgi:hypothetical protein
MKMENVTFKVTLRYRPYGNTDTFDVFTGNSEADAINNLNVYIEKCKEKHGHYISPLQFCETNNEIQDTNSVAVESARGKHFIGKVWVANTTTKDKRRVPEAELSDYYAKGYVKAGPRTKL